jgi:hypothetical protein
MNRAHSYSSLSALASCAQYFKLAYGEGLEEPGVNLPMAAGSALDAALNVLYTKAWDAKLAIAALRESWGDTRPPLGAKHAHLTLGFLEERVRVYMREREASPTMLEAARDEGRIISAFSGIKHQFQWPHGGKLVTLRGIPDFALRDEKGRVWPLDIKCTTGWLSDHWLMQFRIGHQLRIYAAMLQQLEGVEIAGGLINAVYMGDKALDETDAWKRRKSVPSALHRIDFTQSQIDETHEWVRGLEAIEATCETTGLWPRNEKACGNYGGCMFLPLCSAPSEAMRNALKLTRFKRREIRVEEVA